MVFLFKLRLSFQRLLRHKYDNERFNYETSNSGFFVANLLGANLLVLILLEKRVSG